MALAGTACSSLHTLGATHCGAVQAGKGGDVHKESSDLPGARLRGQRFCFSSHNAGTRPKGSFEVRSANSGDRGAGQVTLGNSAVPATRGVENGPPNFSQVAPPRSQRGSPEAAAAPQHPRPRGPRVLEDAETRLPAGPSTTRSPKPGPAAHPRRHRSPGTQGRRPAPTPTPAAGGCGGGAGGAGRAPVPGVREGWGSPGGGGARRPRLRALPTCLPPRGPPRPRGACPGSPRSPLSLGPERAGQGRPFPGLAAGTASQRPEPTPWRHGRVRL